MSKDNKQGSEELHTHSFFAMMDRMQYINRWGLMWNNRTENIKEHSMDVAIVAHALATIRRVYFAADKVIPDPLLVMGMALYHDASEIITGDLPTPIKYKNKDIMSAYKKVEEQAAEKLLGLLHEQMRDEYSVLFNPNRSDPIAEEAYRLVKAADRICAYIKCLSEEMSGNREFESAKKAVYSSIQKLSLPEADFFMTHFVPAYGKTLDQITQ